MRTKTSSALLVLAFILALALSGYLAVGFAGMLFSVAFVGGFVLWLLTTYRTPVPPQTFLTPYLVTVIFFVMHVYEEYRGHIELELSQLSGFPVSQGQFLIIAAFAAPVVWLLGAVLSLKGRPFGYFLCSTFLFGMMFGECSHFVSPLLQQNCSFYSAGMYTAVLPIAGGWYTFFQIQKSRKAGRFPESDA